MEKQLKKEIIETLKGLEKKDEAAIKDVIIDKVLERTRGTGLDNEFRNNLIRDLFNSICRFDILEHLLEDREVDEIMVNGPKTIFYEKRGRLYKESRVFDNSDQLLNIIQTMAGKMNKMVNQASPILDVRLTDGSRVNIVLKPVAVDGPVMTIRKFNKEFLRMEDLLNQGTLDLDTLEFLKELVRSRRNIFISGGTSTGKTTFLNLLAGFIASEERIITIEDSAELSITGHSNLVRLEGRRIGTDNVEMAVDIRTLIRTALRMRPDRIIVGEVRGGEAFDMLTAMNTGHEGSMSTGHANSAEDMLLRLLTMIMVGNELKEDVGISLVRRGIDYVVHLERREGRRMLAGVYELDKQDMGLSLHSIIERDESGCLKRSR